MPHFPGPAGAYSPDAGMGYVMDGQQHMFRADPYTDHAAAAAYYGQQAAAAYQYPHHL